MGKLTALQVERAGSGFHPDGDGLYLQVSTGKARSWIYRYALNGRSRDLGLGSAKAIPLKRARELAAEARRLRAEGIDPIEHRRQQRAAQQVEVSKTKTFAECAAAYIAAHEIEWHNAKHRQQWAATLATYVNPVFGALPVGAIDTALVMQAIEPIWRSKLDTADRCRGRIEVILDWAKVRGYREGENPARWRGHLDHLLPAKSKVRKVEHLAALPYDEMPAFMADLRGRNSVSVRCLEFAILCGSRTSEAIGATWDEVDLDAATWTIPARRMKARREHRVALSARALEILCARRGDNAADGDSPVFSATGRPLSHTALLKVLMVAGRGDLTVHGFRSTFRDWAAERTNFPREVAEMALAHAIEDKVEAAYRRGDLFEKRRELMAAWAEFCAKPVTATVVRLRAAE